MASMLRPRNEVKDRFVREVTFVGNVPVRSGVVYNSISDRTRIRRLVDEFTSTKIQHSDANVIEFLTGSGGNGCRHSGSLEEPSYHLQKIYPLYAEGLAKYRRTVLNELEMFDIDYYGDGSWDVPHIRFHGPVSYVDDLPSVYASSAVNLDIPPFQSVDSLTNRVFDVGGAKSLILTEYKPDLEEIYDDPDALVYRSVSELKEKIRFYLENPSVRGEVAATLHDLVLRNHTYACRVEYVVEILSVEASLH
jgi:hypothetical protein